MKSVIVDVIFMKEEMRIYDTCLSNKLLVKTKCYYKNIHMYVCMYNFCTWSNRNNNYLIHERR